MMSLTFFPSAGHKDGHFRRYGQATAGIGEAGILRWTDTPEGFAKPQRCVHHEETPVLYI